MRIMPTETTIGSVIMKTSFTTMATPELAVSRQFEEVKRYGFDGVDLRMIERGMGEVSKNLTQEEANVLRLQMKGSEVPVLMCYNEKLQSGKEGMETSLLEHMKFASMLGIPAIRIFTGLIRNQQDQVLLVSVLKGVLEKDRTGTAIAMQNHINCSVTLHQGLDVCKAIEDRRVSLIFSPDHAILLGEPYDDILPDLAKYSSQLYVADMSSDHKAVLPGQGIMPYTQILRELCRHGFDGYVTLKWERCWHPELAPYGEAFDAFLSWYREALENGGTNVVCEFP